MLRTFLRSKIHRATITEANLNYEGSITIDEEFLKIIDLLPNEKVEVLNFNNGERFETYVIRGKSGSKTICLNGPAARLGQVGDLVSILSYCLVDSTEINKFQPKIIYLTEKNNVLKTH